MGRKNGIEIVFSDTWKQQPLSRSRSRRPGSRDNPENIAIYLEGENIAQGSSKEEAFYLVRDILGAACSLYSGRERITIPFYDRPWELVFHRHGTRVLVSFYHLGSVPDIVILRYPVSLKMLMRESLEAADRVLFSRWDEFKGSIWEKELSSGIRNAKKLVRKSPPEHIRSQQRTVYEKRWTTAPGRPLEFGFRLRPGPHDLLSGDHEASSDLYSLLFEGRLVLWTRGKRIPFSAGLALLQVERMMSALRRVLSAWEQRRPVNARLVSDNLLIGIRLGKDDRIRLALNDEGKTGRSAVLADLDLKSLSEAVLELAGDIENAVLETAPHQSRNARFNEFVENRKELARWYRDLRRTTRINRNTDSYRLEAQRESSGATGGNENVQIRRLGFEQQWIAEAEGLDLDSVFMAQNNAYITTRDAILCLDTSDGHVVWKTNIDTVIGRTMFAASDAVLRYGADGTVALFSSFNGSLRWKKKLRPRESGAPAGISCAPPGVRPLLVLAEGARKLVALDLRTGEVRWRKSVRRGGKFTLRRVGRLLFMTCDDNSVYALDTDRGTIVWRFSGRGRFLFPVTFHKDRLLSISGHPGQAGGQLFAIDAFTGEKLWRLDLGLGPLAPPVITGSTAVVEIGREDRCELWGVSFETGAVKWRRPFEAGTQAHATVGLDDSFLINQAGGIVRCYSSENGRESWKTDLAGRSCEDVPRRLSMWLRGGAVFVPADRVNVMKPTDGSIISYLGDDSPVPDTLRVTPDFDMVVCELSGYIAGYRTSRNLWVVK